MGRILTAAVAAMAASVLAAPAAAASPVPAGPPAVSRLCWWLAPDDWVLVYSTYYGGCEDCVARGERGIAQGEWSVFHCEGVPIGLDFRYDLYVPPGE
jgi:hypothetical protein